jgi:hypothetical protein
MHAGESTPERTKSSLGQSIGSGLWAHGLGWRFGHCNDTGAGEKKLFLGVRLRSSRRPRIVGF